MNKQPLFTSAPKSLCMLRLSAIGDVTHAIAVAQSIEREWPETKLTWIIGKIEAQLLQPLLPNIHFIVFDKKQGWREYLRVWKILKDEDFSALLHMQAAIRASLLALGIKAPYKLGFDEVRVSDKQNWFTNIKVPSPDSPHVVDGFMAFAHALGIKQLKASWDIHIPQQDIAWVQQQISIPSDKKLLVIAPAASKAFKNWTAQGYADVIRYAQQQNFEVVLAGSPHPIEVALGKDIETLLQGSQIETNNLIGKTSLPQMLALLDNAQLVISPDSGPAHMASIVNTPIIGLYAHHDPKRVGPYNYPELCVSIYQQLAEQAEGKPRSQLSWRYRVKDPDAMQKITSEQVISMLEEQINKEDID